jgi:hypothetical protein
MNCRRAQHLLFDFIDGMSNETLRAELDRHLGECPACETFAAEMTRSLALLRRAPVATLDENFNWKVRLAIHRERNALRSGSTSAGTWARAWNMRYATGAGIAFALVLLAGVALERNGTIMFQPATSSSPAPRPNSEQTTVANRSIPTARPIATLPSPTGNSLGTLVSEGSPNLFNSGAAPLGAIDDPARSEALIDSLVEQQLIPLAPEERALYIQRQIHRLQSRLQSQQALPARP